jgi:hypothetical protein
MTRSAHLVPTAFRTPFRFGPRCGNGACPPVLPCCATVPSMMMFPRSKTMRSTYSRRKARLASKSMHSSKHSSNRARAAAQNCRTRAARLSAWFVCRQARKTASFSRRSWTIPSSMARLVAMGQERRQRAKKMGVTARIAFNPAKPHTDLPIAG